MKPLIATVGIAACVLGMGLFAGHRLTPTDSPPETVLWAWERPEAVDFLTSSEATIAVLVGRLRLSGESMTTFPRVQPLTLPEDAPRLAVVRIESDPRQRPVLDAPQRQRVVDAVLAWAAALPAARALQIDFDATVSERPFYRSLLEDLRRQMPAEQPLSITALASWCLGDPWLDGLPIKEAVPMLFRMGRDAEPVRAQLARGVDFSHPLCRSSYGLSSDEPIPALRSGRRLYLFHPRPWTETAFEAFHHRLMRDLGETTWITPHAAG
ncbi:MAG: DUF3142 domain-containing protein [Acidobacteriota bacterium]